MVQIEPLNSPVPGTPADWPITHAARITELEQVLTTPAGKMREQNVRAAIDYHRAFPPNENCPDEFIIFQDGKITPLSEVRDDLYWAEGILQAGVNQPGVPAPGPAAVRPTQEWTVRHPNAAEPGTRAKKAMYA